MVKYAVCLVLALLLVQDVLIAEEDAGEPQTGEKTLTIKATRLTD